MIAIGVYGLKSWITSRFPQVSAPPQEMKKTPTGEEKKGPALTTVTESLDGRFAASVTIQAQNV